MLNVRPSVSSGMHSVIFHPIGLGKVPKYAEFFEAVHCTFRYRNFLIVYREIRENWFPGKFRKFKLLQLSPFYDCFQGKKVPHFKYLGFRSFEITWRPEFTVYSVNSRKIKFFSFSWSNFRKKVFDDAESDFYGSS